MSKVVAALGGLRPQPGGANRVPQHVARTTARLPQDRFQLRKRELNRIEIGTVFREKPELGADVFDRAPHRRTLVTRQVIHDDDVSGRERRREDLLDVREETGPIDRPIKYRGSDEARYAQRPEKRRRMPAPIWRVVGDAGAVQAPAVTPNQIRPDATFIEKHEARGIERRRCRVPRRPGQDDVSAIVFRRAYRFF